MQTLLAGLRGYKRMKDTENRGGRPVNRPAWMGARTRRLKRLTGKRTWYKMKPKYTDKKNKDDHRQRNKESHLNEKPDDDLIIYDSYNKCF